MEEEVLDLLIVRKPIEDDCTPGTGQCLLTQLGKYRTRRVRRFVPAYESRMGALTLHRNYAATLLTSDGTVLSVRQSCKCPLPVTLASPNGTTLLTKLRHSHWPEAAIEHRHRMFKTPDAIRCCDQRYTATTPQASVRARKEPKE